MPGAVYMVWYILTPCFAHQPFTWKVPFGRHVLGFQFSLRRSSENGFRFHYWKLCFGQGGCSAVVTVSVQRIVLGFREQAVFRCESIP